MEKSNDNNIDLQHVKKEFDEILMKHIKRLLEVDTLATSLSFNLSTIACLLLLVERENDIKNYPNSPPEKFTRETFLDELANIGVDIDDTLMNSFQSLAQHAYVSIDSENRYNAQIGTFALVSFLDNLFPGMRGLNLVGYVLQMIKEVASGRKDLDAALGQFDSMLMLKGIPLSQQTLENTQKATLKKPVHKTEKKPETIKISEEFKKALDKKLSNLRTRSKSSDALTKSRIKEIFPKESPQEHQISEITEKEAEEKEAREAAEKAAREAEIAAAEQAAKEAEKRVAEVAAREAALKAKEAELKAAEIAAREAVMKTKDAELKAAEIAAREAEMKAREAELKAREAEINAKQIAETSIKEKESAEIDIEKQIANFQQQIAMPCPICQTGKITSGETENGQEYFSCSNENCGFISWGKPFSFACPLCSNAFLIEFKTQEGIPGLKCPRATCSFRQSYIGPPSQDSSESTDKPKKRRKLIRRVKRK